MATDARRTVMIVAGEYSGDRLGAEIMAAIRRRARQDIAFVGIGGPGMAEQGLESVFPLSDIAVMGLGDVLPAIPRLRRRLRQAVAFADEVRPDLLLTIDSLGFNRRLASRIRTRLPHLPTMHYAAPKLWAWLPGRAKGLGDVFDELLCLFPFEPAFFAQYGLEASFVGHPVVTRASGGHGASFRKAHAIPPDAPLLALLPGSRASEVSRLLDMFARVADRLIRLYPGLWVVAPTVASQHDRVADGFAALGDRCLVVTGEETKFSAFDAADVALAASGTVTLELAATRTPMVVAYRVDRLSAAIARRLIRVRHATLVNILLDRPAIPEFLQQDCTEDNLFAAISVLLAEESVRARQCAAFFEAMRLLGEGGEPPAHRAAARVLARLES